jgi:hypothetical protein
MDSVGAKSKERPGDAKEKHHLENFIVIATRILVDAIHSHCVTVI